MAKTKSRRLPRQKGPEIDGVGLPELLTKIRAEPLTVTTAVKLQSSLAEFLEKHESAQLIRRFIPEGLQRILDQPSPARCSECLNLTEHEAEPFCLILCACLQKKHLKEKWDCDHFQSVKEK